MQSFLVSSCPRNTKINIKLQTLGGMGTCFRLGEGGLEGIASHIITVLVVHQSGHVASAPSETHATQSVEEPLISIIMLLL